MGRGVVDARVSACSATSTCLRCGCAMPCSCGECRDAFSGQRLRGALTLDDQTDIASWRDDGDDIEVTFTPDGHVSRFSRRWLEANAPGRAAVFDDRSERHRPPWRAADLGGRPPEIGWCELSSDGEPRTERSRRCCARVCCWCARVPVEPGTVLTVARSFGYVRTTNYGDLFDVRVEPQPVNLAFTGAGHRAGHGQPVPRTGSGDPAPPLPEVVTWRGRERPHRRLRRGRSAPGRRSTGVRDADVDTAHVQVRGCRDVAARQRPDHHGQLPVGEVRAIRWNDRSIEPPAVEPQEVAEVYRAMRRFAAILDEADLHVRCDARTGRLHRVRQHPHPPCANRVRGRRRCAPPAGLLRGSRRDSRPTVAVLERRAR